MKCPVCDSEIPNDVIVEIKLEFDGEKAMLKFCSAECLVEGCKEIIHHRAAQTN